MEDAERVGSRRRNYSGDFFAHTFPTTILPQNAMPYWFDGNNLIGQSAAVARLDPGTRRAFLSLLGGYASGRGGRFEVYFDGDARDSALPPRGVRVRYSAPVSSDDAILSGVEGARSPGDIIVVTNDRDLAARCRSAGAKTMDWSQFTKKMAGAARVRRKDAGREEKVDLDEWARFFGIDPDRL
ncbi:MAG: hypothetical protein H6Q05_760 [Acidobacteria bacterium]|jgi:hypothetical protein|nr:hypothetical protein [Acidobacteriota bacterium]